MKNNRPTKWKGREHFRVLTFDELQYKNPSLKEYIKSLKTWFHKAYTGLSDTPKRDVATSTKALRMTRSSSAIAMRSTRNNVLKKYTRSRTLSLEDLKRLFVIKKVFSFDKLQASQIYSKKRNLRTKVKNGEEYLNKWDREIKVLYSNETNKACRPKSRYSTNPIPTDGEVPVSSSSTFGSSQKMGLIINCGRKECHAIPNCKDPGVSDYRSKYCTSKKIRPHHEEKFLREDRHDNANQCREAKVLINRACSAMASRFCRPRRKEAAHKMNKACTCCVPNFPIRKSTPPYTDYANYQKSNKMCTCCSKRNETSPKMDFPYLPTHMHNNIKKRTTPADPKTDYAETQTCNYICVKCSNHKQVAPKTNYTQTPNNERTWRKRRKTNYAKTQTSNEICILCYCPSEKTVNPKTDYANIQTSNNEFTCCCPKRKDDGAKHTSTQKSNSTYPVCGCSKTKEDNTQMFSNVFTDSYPKRKKDVSKYNRATQTFIDLFAWGCSKQKELESEIAYAYTQTSNSLFTHKQSKQNTLRAYFSKLRRRNIRRQTGQKSDLRQLKNAHKKSATSSITTADEMFGSQSTSRARREAVLLAVKHCPRCNIPVFPDSSLCSKNTSSQTQFEGGNGPQTSNSAQTSELNPRRVCSCLQKIVKRQDVTPDQRKQYILYHNSARGWLVKPLRTRQFNCLDDKLSLSQMQGQKPCGIDRPTCAHNEMHNKPAGNHDRCNFSKNPNECSSSCWASDSNLSRNFRVRNSPRNELCRNIYEKSKNIHKHNSSTNFHECHCSPVSHEHNLSRKVYENNSHKNVHLMNSSGNVHDLNFSSKFPGCNCSHENKNVHVTNNSSKNVPAHNSSKNPCNCLNFNNSLFSNRKRDTRNFPTHLCKCSKTMEHPKVRSNVVYPSSLCPPPCCIKGKNVKFMTKKIHIRDRSKKTFRVKKSIRKPFRSSKRNTKTKKQSSVAKRRSKKSDKSHIGCEWVYCSTPRCAFIEWCSGCKKCCKIMVVAFTAVLICPIWGLMFLLHDLFFPCL